MKADIIYRACGKETTPENCRDIRPHWFDKRKCFRSIWEMTEADPSTFSLHVVYDGPDSSLFDYIKQFRVSDGAIIRVDYNGYASMNAQWEYADKLTGDWLYFVEDDYLHAPDAARVLLEGMARFDLISLYDHLDRYTRSDDITINQESVAVTNSCHWRTAESTCTTFACSRKLWSQINYLAKERGPSDRHFFQDLIRLGIRLWTPMPARSTHCFLGYMSPLVNWNAIAEGIHL